MANITQIREAKSLVVKVGTAAITKNSGINEDFVNELAFDCESLISLGRDVMIVTSGAIACGRRECNQHYRENETLAEKKRYAAIGQVALMQTYKESFRKKGIIVAQHLLTYDDLDSKKRLIQLRETYEEHRKNKDVVIVNENDVIATEEITFGDNDMLAAYIARDLDFDALINLTLHNGLLKNGKTVEIATSFSPSYYDKLKQDAREGRGGLKSKLESAKLVTESGKLFAVANSRHSLMNILTEMVPYTRFLPILDKSKR